MSRGGHALVALAVGGYIVLVVQHGALLGAATAVAGGLPDALEGVIGFGPRGERRSLIPHRTLTHSPWLWVAVLVAGLLLPAAATPWGQIAIGKVAAGLAAGALVHLVLDLFSPTGIPLGNPFGPRVSLGPYRSARGNRYLYRTSTTEEWPLLLPFGVLVATELVALGLRAFAGSAGLAALAQRVLAGS